MELRREASGIPSPGEAAYLHPQMLTSLPGWDELLSSCLQITARLLGAQQCALFLAGAEENGTHGLMLAGAWDEAAGAIRVGWPAPRTGLRPCEGREEASLSVLQPGMRGCRSGEATGTSRFLPCVCAPVVIDGHRYGVLEVTRLPGGVPLGESDARALQLAAHHLAICLRSSSAHLGLRKLADTDGLTGVFNYRRFQMQLGVEVERSDRHGRVLSLMMLDLNNFKGYNDRFGHQRGDMALRRIAATLERTVRRIDVVARYGGDEFAVILPETGPTQALVVARRIRKAVREHTAAMPLPGTAECLAVSIGISSYPSLASSKEELIAQADEAMYRAKQLRTEMVRVWRADWQRPSRGSGTELEDPAGRLRLFDVPPQ
jgi:diguanylate cyclase (GGDEF)-like protein